MLPPVAVAPARVIRSRPSVTVCTSLPTTIVPPGIVACRAIPVMLWVGMTRRHELRLGWEKERYDANRTKHTVGPWSELVDDRERSGVGRGRRAPRPGRRRR